MSCLSRKLSRRSSLAALLGLSALQTACPPPGFWHRHDERHERRGDRHDERHERRGDRHDDRHERHDDRHDDRHERHGDDRNERHDDRGDRH
jgi:hypothetical protein